MIQRLPVAAALLGALYVAYRAATYGGVKFVLATLIGVIAGFALYHAAFGFTGAWRRIVTEQRGVGLRAQVMLLGLTALIAYPLIGWYGTGAWVHPVGIGMIVGAFLFGMGMQLGGGCGSGTLFTVGGGSSRMVITLSFFIIGSMFGRAHASWWRDLPSFERMSFIREFGVPGALLITFALLAAIWIASTRIERAAHGTLETGRKTGSIVMGPWSPWLGALGLVFVSIATLLVLNRPWGITAAFPFWGAKIADGIGLPITEYSYWKWSENALSRSVFQNTTSIMDFGLMLGALAASGLAGKFAPVWRLNRTEVLTAIAGGLLMGFGARLAYGCNIGAYLGGVASGSIHAWAWALAAFAGSSLVAWWRMPRMGAPVPA